MSQKNNPLELYIANKFRELGFKYARPSKGSGAFGELGDSAGQNLFVCEAKMRNTKDITIRRDVWLKLLREIPLHSQRKALYILENNSKNRYAVMDLDDFFRLLEQLKSED